MRSVIVVAVLVVVGCADIRERQRPECYDLPRGEIGALLEIAMPRDCDPSFPSAMDFAAWRPVGGDVSIGGDFTTCVYRSGDAPFPRAEVVTVNGVPVDASVTLPPRSNRTCIATVGEVCMPDGVCARIE